MIPLDRAVAFRLHRIQRLLRANLLGLLRPFDLTPEQYFALMRLGERDGRVQGELGDPTLDDRASVSRMVAAMEERDLVVRSRRADDHRAWVVHLTERGRALLDALAEPVDRARERLFGAVPPADLAALHRVLDRIEHVLTR
jgi:DNA-binding MarR family transcriptional regulator